MANSYSSTGATLNGSTFRDFDVQILTDHVRGAFANKSPFLGSVLVSNGAVALNSSMPYGSPDFIGSEVTMPYFGTLGEFSDNPDGTAIAPQTLKQTNEKATITRSSLACEVSRWAQHASTSDPYAEAVTQIGEAARREMDKRLIAKAAATPLVSNVFVASSAGASNRLSYDTVVDAQTLWRDEAAPGAVLITHSRGLNDLRKLKDTQGRPLVVDSFRTNEVPQFAGMSIVVSDRVPMTGSVMGTVSSTGTGTEPTMTITGEPLGAWKLKVVVVSGTALGTATIKFSLDGGMTYSAPLTTAAAATPLPLTDTAIDSLIGYNGKSGISVAFSGDFSNVDNTYTSTAVLCVTALIVKPGALAFWYSAANMGLETDKLILAHTDLAAMHLYGAAHMYRRVSGGTLPGVVAIKHNVSGYE